MNNCTICNRELDHSGLIHINYLLEQYQLSNQLATLLTYIMGSIQILINEAEKYPEEKRKILTLVKTIEDKKEELVNTYNDIQSQLLKYSNKNRITLLQRERLDLEEQEKKLTNTLIRYKIEKEDYEKSEIKIKEKLDKEINKQNQYNATIAEKNYAEKAQKIVTCIIEEIKDGVRLKIGKELQNKFFELIWKEKTFSKVELSESYLLSLYNIDGFECLGSCSAAERALLALAFTLALHNESGFEGPLVVDSPIRNISGILRERLAEVLREISKEKQIILFLTQDEYSNT
jgi:DNA sulfur modification protein DndD